MNPSIAKEGVKTRYLDQGKNIGAKAKAISVKYPLPIEQLLDKLPNRSEYIREAVLQKLTEDGLLK